MPKVRKRIKKKVIEPSEMVGFRLSTHEKVCAERMKTLFKAIDEMRQDIKDLRKDVNKGKGAVNLLIIIGGLVTAIIGYFKFNG
tara:strand:+ start:102 stop:353 length:252 start_codon:yes stop_codon:yes gene_type:complete